MDTREPQIDYKTHILIGVRADGVMNVVEDWPHLPSQADVQGSIDGTRGPYVAFALCTPTSIMPGKRATEVKKDTPSRFGAWSPIRRP